MSNYKFYHPKTGKSFDSAGNAIQVESEVDFVTGANRFVRNDHAYIHEGKAYSIAIKDLNLANDGTKYLQFSTKSEIYNHFKYIQTVDCKVSIYENPDSIDDAGSTQYTPINQNRLSTNTADTT